MRRAGKVKVKEGWKGERRVVKSIRSSYYVWKRKEKRWDGRIGKLVE